MSGRIHAGHFRSFAANQRAASLFATFCNARDDIFCNSILEFAGGKIVEEKQRLSALS